MSLTPVTPKRPYTTEDSNCRSEERRSARRYLVSADAYFAWQEGEGRNLNGTGSTRDISDHGAFIQAVRTPAVGSNISVVLTLPNITGHATRKSQLRGRGTVVRVVADTGFVVDVSFRILRAEPIDTRAGFGLVC